MCILALMYPLRAPLTKAAVFIRVANTEENLFTEVSLTHSRAWTLFKVDCYSLLWVKIMFDLKKCLDIMSDHS